MKNRNRKRVYKIPQEREFYREVGRNIRRIRISQRMSLQCMVEECGLVSPASLWEIESGRRGVSTARLCMIADALAMPLSELVGSARKLLRVQLDVS